MSLEKVTEEFRRQAAKAPNLGKSLKFVFDEGVVFMDLSGDEAQVTNEDKDADCTVHISVDTLDKIRRGELNPMTALMTGKVKVKGDMGLALKLQSLLS